MWLGRVDHDRRMTQSHPIRSRLKQLPLYPAFKQLGHYPDYWWWKLRGEPRRIPHLIKQRTVLEYAQRFGLTTLIETGTYYGEMIAAVVNRFRRIYSIELDPRLAMQARERFRRYPRVEIIEGDSQTLVPNLLQRIDERCLFWLDAGYCGWSGKVGNPDRLGSELVFYPDGPHRRPRDPDGRRRRNHRCNRRARAAATRQLGPLGLPPPAGRGRTQHPPNHAERFERREVERRFSTASRPPPRYGVSHSAAGAPECKTFLFTTQLTRPEGPLYPYGAAIWKRNIDCAMRY